MLTGSDKDLHGLNDSNTNFSVVCVNITGEVEEREYSSFTSQLNILNTLI